MGMPFSGYWDRFGIAHPSYHGPSGNSYADWATDVYAAAGTAVRPRFSGPSLALKVASVSTTCGSAGKTVVIDVHTNGVFVGTARYGHLSSVPVAAGQWISQDTIIGSLAQYGYQAGCWEVRTSEGVHTHVTGYNLRGYSCYVDVGSRSFQSAGVTIGAVGGTLGAGVRSQCSSDPTPPPPPPPPPENPFGYLDVVSSPSPGVLRVRGWAADPSAKTTPLSIHIYAGSTNLTTSITANKSRPDVGAAHPGYGDNHGFDDTFGVSVRGAQTICAYAINVGSGNTNTQLGCKPVTIASPPAWAGEYVSQSAFLDCTSACLPWDITKSYPGQEGWLVFRVKNTGTQTWRNTGPNPTRLGTASPRDRASSFYVSGAWVSPNRPALMQEPTAAPGQTATFVFKTRVPPGTTTIREHYQVVVEGKSWLGPAMWRDFVRTGTPPEPDGTLPGRFIDTRMSGQTVDGLSAGVGAVPAGDRVEAVIAGRPGVPAGTEAVVYNLTITNAKSRGYATVYSCDERPSTSSLNFAAGTPRANSGLIALSNDGSVCIFTSAEANVVFDITGVLNSGDFESEGPVRVADSRSASTEGTVDGEYWGGGPLRQDHYWEIATAGRGIPAGATSVAYNLTITQAASVGYATVYPCGELPGTSSINYAQGAATANAGTMSLSSTGSLCVYSNTTAEVIVDITGWFSPDSFGSLVPRRVWDTRPGRSTFDGIDQATGQLDRNGTREIRVEGRGVPSGATAAAFTIASVRPSESGYITVYNCDTGRPLTSTLNFREGETIANSGLMPISDEGSICVFASKATHVILDLTGYLRG